jgi:spore maturation protein CgeB
VADEVAHAPRLITAEIERQWSSKVAFVGTWMPERGPFFRELIERGVPLTIFGDGWEKAPEWPVLQPVRRTSSLEGDEYCYAIQCAKINIGMISIGNRDLHTQRSLEIPALGSVLCAKRTSEHEQLYVDGKEALFWNDAEECARICMGLLDDEIRRKRLALAGQERARSNGHFSEPLLTRILQEAFA